MNGGHRMGESIRDKSGLRKEEPNALLIPTDRDGLQQTVACIYNLPNTPLRPKERREEGSQDPHCLGLGKGSLCNANTGHSPPGSRFSMVSLPLSPAGGAPQWPIPTLEPAGRFSSSPEPTWREAARSLLLWSPLPPGPAEINGVL